MPGTADDSFGSWARTDACVWDLNAERGSSTMSLSLADRRDVDEAASSSSWATLGPPEEPLGKGDLSDSAAMVSVESEIC